MANDRCPNCGLVCGSTDGFFCRRCGAKLTSSGPPSFQQQQMANRGETGLPLVPAYGGRAQSANAALPFGNSRYAGPAGGVWRQGPILVFQKHANLPDRCLKCNAPASGARLKKTLAWHHPALFLLIFAGLLVYGVAALIVRKTAKVSLGFCGHHLRQRRNVLILNWGLFGAGLLAFVLAIAQGSGRIAIAGVVLLFAGATAGTVLGRYVRIKRMDDQYIWLKGVSQAYLAELPHVP